jgi:hypothetical protein
VTDNEKAATFIGWKPELEPAQPSYPNLKLYHPYRGYMPAPDMSDPRNYMKALEESNVHYQIRGGPDKQWDRQVWLQRNDNSVEIERFTVVEALAALYDAENKRTLAVR